MIFTNSNSWQNEGAIHNPNYWLCLNIDYAAWFLSESDKSNIVDGRCFICITFFSLLDNNTYILNYKNKFWSIAPSVVDIHLVMTAITLAETTVRYNKNTNTWGWVTKMAAASILLMCIVVNKNAIVPLSNVKRKPLFQTIVLKSQILSW